ncbi:unnamed protein product [Protopolystoma xenopodis]|uniref:Uncharacterized protein n=1 Tax=Protopolystoma xenopodis TaxID=117903 RepID=A0A3S5A3X1_9PLAT|nr:unnamed protein product [Protopolystoma xenopodis]
MLAAEDTTESDKSRHSQSCSQVTRPVKKRQRKARANRAPSADRLLVPPLAEVVMARSDGEFLGVCGVGVVGVVGGKKGVQAGRRFGATFCRVDFQPRTAESGRIPPFKTSLRSELVSKCEDCRSSHMPARTDTSTNREVEQTTGGLAGWLAEKEDADLTAHRHMYQFLNGPIVHTLANSCRCLYLLDGSAGAGPEVDMIQTSRGVGKAIRLSRLTSTHRHSDSMGEV